MATMINRRWLYWHTLCLRNLGQFTIITNHVCADGTTAGERIRQGFLVN